MERMWCMCEIINGISKPFEKLDSVVCFFLFFCTWFVNCHGHLVNPCLKCAKKKTKKHLCDLSRARSIIAQFKASSRFNCISIIGGTFLCELAIETKNKLHQVSVTDLCEVKINNVQHWWIEIGSFDSMIFNHIFFTLVVFLFLFSFHSVAQSGHLEFYTNLYAQCVSFFDFDWLICLFGLNDFACVCVF